jgi:chemotaxis protein histidine kinase CheA
MADSEKRGKRSEARETDPNHGTLTSPSHFSLLFSSFSLLAVLLLAGAGCGTSERSAEQAQLQAARANAAADRADASAAAAEKAARDAMAAADHAERTVREDTNAIDADIARINYLIEQRDRRLRRRHRKARRRHHAPAPATPHPGTAGSEDSAVPE